MFSNFALILVWTLFLLPKGQGDTLGGDPPPEFVKDSSEKGEGTGLGAQVAKVTIDVKSGTIVVRQDGETTSLNEFIDTQGVFPMRWYSSWQGWTPSVLIVFESKSRAKVPALDSNSNSLFHVHASNNSRWSQRKLTHPRSRDTFLGWIVQLGLARRWEAPCLFFLNVKHTWWFGIRIEIEEAFHISSHSGRSRVSFAN